MKNKLTFQNIWSTIKKCLIYEVYVKIIHRKLFAGKIFNDRRGTIC